MRLIVFTILFVLFSVIPLKSQHANAWKTNNFNTSTSIAIMDDLSTPNKHALIPTYDGFWHALAVVNANFKSNQIEVLSVIDDRFDFNGEISQLIHVRFKPEEIKSVIGDENITYLDLSSRLNAPKPFNDTTRVFSNVHKVELGVNNSLKQNYTGINTFVGIVDIGFQTDHPTFFDRLGRNTRINSLWHQQHATGTNPTGFLYGSEYKDTQEILTAIDNDGTHGTHVAGIAAGSGLNSPGFKYRGMAPDANLCFVGIKYANDTLSGSALGDYVVANPTILDGFQYIFNKGAQLNMPVVSNLSWGMHTGPHDGSSLFDQAIEAMVGPGKIIVGAAGNDGGNNMHVGRNLSGDTIYSIAIDRSRKDYPKENVYIDAWGDPNKKFSIQVSLVDTLGNIKINGKWNAIGDCFNCGAYKERLVNGTDTVDIIWSEQVYPGNNKPNGLLIIESNKPKENYIRIGFTSESGFHAWNSGQTYRWTSGSFISGHKDIAFSAQYESGTRNYSVGENGGSGNKTLSVGAYVARNQWLNYLNTPINEPWLTPGEVASFSSRGPLPSTQDFSVTRQKPDIIAPGHHIASALHKNQYASWMDNQIVHKQTWRGQDQYYVQFSGTSMAAPHVAGIVALYLQANPNLSPEDVKNLWRFYHTRDQFTGSDSNSLAGYGKIDAYSAIQFLEKFLLVSPANKQPHVLVYDAYMKQLHILSESSHAFEDFCLMSSAGKVVFKRAKINCNTLDIPNLSNGIYYYCYNSNGIKYSGKLFIDN